jgi:hypothetical protein
MKRYFDWSLMVGAIGLLGPPGAFLTANMIGLLFTSALVFCVWLLILVWGLCSDGVRALLLMVPSFLMILVRPSAYAALAIACTYYYPCL